MAQRGRCPVADLAQAGDRYVSPGEVAPAIFQDAGIDAAQAVELHIGEIHGDIGETGIGQGAGRALYPALDTQPAAFARHIGRLLPWRQLLTRRRTRRDLRQRRRRDHRRQCQRQPPLRTPHMAGSCPLKPHRPINPQNRREAALWPVIPVTATVRVKALCPPPGRLSNV